MQMDHRRVLMVAGTSGTAYCSGRTAPSTHFYWRSTSRSAVGGGVNPRVPSLGKLCETAFLFACAWACESAHFSIETLFGNYSLPNDACQPVRPERSANAMFTLHSDGGNSMEIRPDEIAVRWHQYFVNELQERYGLTKNEARQKADALWQSTLGQTITAAAISSGRRPSRTSSGNLRSGAGY